MKHLDYCFDDSEDSRNCYQTLWKKVGLGLLQQHNPPSGQVVLDWGCGRGESMMLCRSMGYTPKGVDVDPTCLALSGKNGEVMSLNEADPVGQLGENSVDSIVSFHVLEHVSNPSMHLESMRAIARRYIVIGVPNLRQLTRLFCRTVSLQGFNTGHRQSWDHWHLLNLAVNHVGLRFVAWGHDATLLPGNYVLERLIGLRNTVRLESKLFNKLFPFHCMSVIGLFDVNKKMPGHSD